ncbi:MAG: zinc ribbon domain-containing protein [Anaerolineales bacterium]|nr:zinc ribbon domain-containing protein [Anaerolineales bacterium]
MSRSKKSFPWGLALSLLLLLASALNPLPVRAQAVVKFASLEVDLWPEYDRQAVLVIYRITLSPDVGLPVDLTVRIPAAVGEPSAVAVKEADGGIYDQTYTREVNGEWSQISFTATMPEIQIEYYDPQLVKQGTQRRFAYHWPGDYAIENLIIQVQQPLGVEEMNITPALGAQSTDENGLTYYTTQAGALAAGNTFDVTLEYQKTGDGLTSESLQVKPSAPVSNITSSQRNTLLVLPYFLAGLGVALIVGGGLWYWRSGVARSAPAPRRRRKSAPGRETASQTPEEYIYCRHCGKRALPNDRFCRACGTRLRV